jgi:hypothetical protein
MMGREHPTNVWIAREFLKPNISHPPMNNVAQGAELHLKNSAVIGTGFRLLTLRLFQLCCLLPRHKGVEESQGYTSGLALYMRGTWDHEMITTVGSSQEHRWDLAVPSVFPAAQEATDETSGPAGGKSGETRTAGSTCSRSAGLCASGCRSKAPET